MSPEEARLQYVRSSQNHIIIEAVSEAEYIITWKPQKKGVYSLDFLIDSMSILDEPRTIIVEENVLFSYTNTPLGPSTISEEACKNEPSSLECDNDIAMLPSATKFRVLQEVPIRSFPAIESIETGTLPVGTTVDIIDKVINEEGLWVKLHGDCIVNAVEESMRHLEAWVPHQLSEIFGGNLFLEDLLAIENDDQKATSPLSFSKASFLSTESQ